MEIHENTKNAFILFGTRLRVIDYGYAGITSGEKHHPCASL